MPKLAANLGFLYGELPFEARFEAAAQGGFQGVEYIGPYVARPVCAGWLGLDALVGCLYWLLAGACKWLQCKL